MPEAPVDAAVVARRAPPPPPKKLFARKLVSRVFEGPSLETAQRGFMRAGAVLTAKTAESIGHDRCRRGWYEIAETGGFVCDGREVTAFNEAEGLPDRARNPADRAGPLPYRYAYSRGKNMYAAGVNSGLPVTASPTSQGVGSLIAGAVELSNTDIGTSLIQLISAATQYRGNARVITAAQQLLDELLNLRR